METKCLLGLVALCWNCSIIHFFPAGCWINTGKPFSLFTIYQLKNNAKWNQLGFFLSNKEKWKELPGFFYHWLMEVDQSGMNWLFTTSMSWLWTKVSLKHKMSNSGLMIHSILDCHAMIQHQVNSSLPKTSPVLGQYVLHNCTCCTRAKCCILMSTINVL